MCHLGMRVGLNDSELVQRLRAQDPEAVRELTDRYLPSIWRFVYYRVNGDSHLAEDIVSESVLALVRAVAEEAEIDNPIGWLRAVASHKVLDHFRAVARVQHLIGQVALTAELVQPEEAVGQQELVERRAEVRQALDGLPDQHRMALEWKYIERLSVRQIAARLEVTEKAAESILFRARRTFREKLLRTAADQDGPGTKGGSRPPETGQVEFRAVEVQSMQTPGS